MVQVSLARTCQVGVEFPLATKPRMHTFITAMADPLAQYEALLDRKYAEMKAALKALRENAPLFQLPGNTCAGSNDETSAKLAVINAAAEVRGKGVTAAVREKLESFPNTFSLEDLAIGLPQFTRQQISNVITTLKQSGDIHVVKPGIGQSTAKYGKGPKLKLTL